METHQPTVLNLDGKKDTTESLFDQTRLAQAKARLEAEMSKSDLESQRYKQDCRKRSLDLAHNELELLLRESKGADFNTTEVADKYYTWLISIPETTHP